MLVAFDILLIAHHPFHILILNPAPPHRSCIKPRSSDSLTWIQRVSWETQGFGHKPRFFSMITGKPRFPIHTLQILRVWKLRVYIYICIFCRYVCTINIYIIYIYISQPCPNLILRYIPEDLSIIIGDDPRLTGTRTRGQWGSFLSVLNGYHAYKKRRELMELWLQSYHMYGYHAIVIWWTDVN